MTKEIYDLRHLSWTLTGWSPFEWRLPRSLDPATGRDANVPPIPVQVPGSVQQALLQAGLIPDWTRGVQTQACEWVENRHWVFTTHIPTAWLKGKQVRLNALGLDHAGWVLVNGQEVGTFANAFVPQVFDLSTFVPRDEEVTLSLIFACPARWLGQFGYTSEMTAWEPRFNYTWDWTPRLVQIGIWDDLLLEVSDGLEIAALRCTTQVEERDMGMLRVQAEVAVHPGASVCVTLREAGSDEQDCLFQKTYRAEILNEGISKTHLPVRLWYPNGSGTQPLYQVLVQLFDADGLLVDSQARQVGFKVVNWRACEDAPPEADPWLCVVNGEPIFLQGVNWTPIRTTFADVSRADYQLRLNRYREMGCNLLRVWGGAFLEKSCFYELCDEYGLLVWQELPLSSSGLDNAPPEDAQSVQSLQTIALSYIQRRQHHVSLLLWCGGNELQEQDKPINLTSPLIRHLRQVMTASDPDRRFLTSSPSGPRFTAKEEEMGQGYHWDTHGPWLIEGNLTDWTRYWQHDDSLFRSEVGAPGASSPALLRALAGDQAVFPVTWDNPLWRRSGWWIEYPRFVEAHGHDPETLEEYTSWSQQRQAEALFISARACKSRFPRCGGFLVWMGHDAFPCTANTSILDFAGEMKPAAHALSQIFHTTAAALRDGETSSIEG